MGERNLQALGMSNAPEGRFHQGSPSLGLNDCRSGLWEVPPQCQEENGVGRSMSFRYHQIIQYVANSSHADNILTRSSVF